MTANSQMERIFLDLLTQSSNLLSYATWKKVNLGWITMIFAILLNINAYLS